MKLFKNTQSGRSMVEMLGVLAIIGVLSVGGIAGYSKAMFKHKINATLDTLSQIIARVIEVRESNPQIGSVYGENINKIGFDCKMVEADAYGNKECALPIGTYTLNLYTSSVELYIAHYGGSNEAVDLCTNFFSSKIYENVPIEWWNNSYGNILIFYGNGDSATIYAKAQSYLDRGAKSELNVQDISNACSPCTHGCQIVWYMWQA